MNTPEHTPEAWRPVAASTSGVEVSDQGRARRGGSFLRPIMSAGYLAVSFDSKEVLLHRLVLEAFVGPAPAGMEACHKDGDRGNNRLSNLRWDTKSANEADKRDPAHVSRVATSSAPATRTCDVCREDFAPSRVDQVRCSTECRRAAWRREHPTYDEMVAMPQPDLERTLDRLADARGGAVIDLLPTSMPSRIAGALEALAEVPHEDFLAALRLLVERRYPGRRGRLRVRFGAAGDAPMTDGVC